jgi:hypothetical protein
VIHNRLGERKRFRYDPAQRFGIGPVLDDEVFAVDEAVGPDGNAGFVSGMANAVTHGVVFHRGELQIGRW